jgi:hypothetical protein
MRKVLVALAGCAALSVAAPLTAGAAPNPSGTGQPSAECGEAGAEQSPTGFGTGGFANAETQYAGSDGTPSAANGSSSAVSQYDVACYQVTQEPPR